jgi:hypothetical protein
VVEENKRPDHRPLPVGQQAADLEAAEIAATGLDHPIDHIGGDAAPAGPGDLNAGR